MIRNDNHEDGQDEMNIEPMKQCWLSEASNPEVELELSDDCDCGEQELEMIVCL